MEVVTFLGAETTFVVRELAKRDAKGRRVLQVVDLRCVGEVIEKRAYFLAYDGKRWSRNRDHYALEGRFPGVLKVIRDDVLRRQTIEAAVREGVVVTIRDRIDRGADLNPPPSPNGGETAPAPRRRAA